MPVDSSLNSVTKRILLILRDKGKNVSQAARDLDVPQPTLNDIATGKTKPNLVIFKALCSVYGIDPLWLAFGTGNPYIDRERLPAAEEAGEEASDAISVQHSPSLSGETGKTLTPRDYILRNPDLAVPGLLELLDSRLSVNLQLSMDEMEAIARTVRAMPSLWRAANSSLILSLVRTFRVSRVSDIDRVIETMNKEKGQP